MRRRGAESTSPDFPDERPVVCRNPLLAEQRARKRDELPAATETDLARIRARVQQAKKPLRGAAEIGKAVGAVIGKHKACPRALDLWVAKHFELSIIGAAFSYAQKDAAITAEARLDGIYVVRTTLPAEASDAAQTVKSYKSLAQVEQRAWRRSNGRFAASRPWFWTCAR